MKTRTTHLSLVVILLLSLVTACSQGSSTYSDSYENVTNNELKALLQRGVTLVDIRRPEEWKQTGVVAGSHKITMFDQQGRIAPDFQQKFMAITEPDKPVALICRTGNRTRAAGRLLSEHLGYKHIYNVERGITDWIRQGNPVVKD